MSREVKRKLRSPNADHMLARRNGTGTVQTSAASSATGLSTTDTTTTTLDSFTISNPNLVLNTEGTLTVGAAATNGTTVAVTRNGTTTVTSVSGSTSTMTFGINTHTTPLNSPSYNLTIQASGNSASVSYSLSREDRWI